MAAVSELATRIKPIGEARKRLAPNQPTEQLSLVFPPRAVSSQLSVPARCAGDRLGQSGDDDQRACRLRGSHTGDDTERDEQTVLGAEHELSDAREPPDPRGLTEGVLADVPCRFLADRNRVASVGVPI